MSGRRVLLVGWDAADWKVIRPLMEAGRMPHLRRLVENGCSAPIATLQPSYSPMLWTTIATGKRPFQHGIHGFTEPRPDGSGIHRVTNLSRRCKALWNILGQNGLRSIVVGWWPSYPAEPIRGVMVSDQFHRSSPDFRLVPAMVHPAELGEPLAALRLNPEDLPADVLEFFVPRAREIDQTVNRRMMSAAHVICECANIHSAATWLMDREPWDLCAVYFDAIDHFGHGFMKFNPPRREWVDEEDYELFHGVLRAGYELHDKMLGTLLGKAGGDATVVLVSDHGFHPDHLRPASIPKLHAGPAVEHRNNGVFVMAGPGIRKGAEIGGVSLPDITPTVLSLFGLAAGADMDGRLLTGLFESAPRTGRIPSWEKVDGDDGRHPPHMQLDPMAATESLEQLVALGYVEEPDADREKAVQETMTELRTNLAEAYQDAGRHGEAAAILRELREGGSEEPESGHAGMNDERVAMRLFFAEAALRRTGAMEAIAADWGGRRRALYERSLARIDELRRLARKRAEEPERDPGEPLLDEGQRAELKALRRVCRFDPSLAVYFEAQVLRARRRWAEALACLDRIPAADLVRPGLFVERAELLGRLNRRGEAEAILDEALARDATDARVHFGLCRAALRRRDFSAAAHAALDGLALLDQYAAGHYMLGIALTGLGAHGDARTAFTRALSVNPNFPQAHLWLARICRRFLGDAESAARHSGRWNELQTSGRRAAGTTAPRGAATPEPRRAAFAGSARELPPITDETVIVTGLPRSGTSMLMQMLVAGGLTPLVDGIRQADEDNPRGYFEYEPVKQLAQNASWFDQAKGKAVKIVAPMMPNLPDGVPCRVILIERDIDEVLASQRQMIVRRGREVASSPARQARLKQEYLRLIVWTKGFLAGRPGTKLMCVDRNAVLRDPATAARVMNRFLGGTLNEALMAAEVKPELNRQKGESGAGSVIKST